MTRRDPVTPAMRDRILERDQVCTLWRMDNDHQCRDIYGTPHAPNDWGRLTLEHVKSELRMGLRAPSDERHLIALCGAVNNRVPSKVEREAFRAYLERVNAA